MACLLLPNQSAPGTEGDPANQPAPESGAAPPLRPGVIVKDCGRYSYEGAPADGSIWEFAGACAWRMMRGGSWLSLPRASRPANRVRNPDGYQDVHVGFRVVRSLF